MKQTETKKTYGETFFDTLVEHIKLLEESLDVDENGNLKKTFHNTQLWAKALHVTFCDMGDIAGALVMGASCEWVMPDIKTD